MNGAGIAPPDAVEADPAFAEATLRDLLGAFRHIRMTVSGACMTPSLSPGQVVYIEGVAHHTPRFGEIVLASDGKTLRLHRLVWPFGRRRTRADRAVVWDPRLGPEDVLGTVVWIEDSGRPGRFWAGCKSLVSGMLARARQVLFPVS
jgi:hypothetical protein